MFWLLKTCHFLCSHLIIISKKKLGTKVGVGWEHPTPPHPLVLRPCINAFKLRYISTTYSSLLRLFIDSTDTPPLLTKIVWIMLFNSYSNIKKHNYPIVWHSLYIYPHIYIFFTFLVCLYTSMSTGKSAHHGSEEEKTYNDHRNTLSKWTIFAIKLFRY
jgi:hypothetical protein